MPGQRSKGIYVDCAQLIAGALDELFRRKTPCKIPRLPPNSGMHYDRAAFRVIRAFRTNFSTEVVRDGVIEPGDIVLTRGVMDELSPRRAGHVLIAGVCPWTFLHAVPNMGVCWTSIEALPGILRYYRLHKKAEWA